MLLAETHLLVRGKHLSLSTVSIAKRYVWHSLSGFVSLNSAN
jgi:hypothetical protein